MFYSHERESSSKEFTAHVLTSRSPDQSPVRRGHHLVKPPLDVNEWLSNNARLVATLGSKSKLKKVTRKAILDVNVPKACDKITNKDAPLALRLQGSLLYMASRTLAKLLTDRIVAMASRASTISNACMCWLTRRASATR